MHFLFITITLIIYIFAFATGLKDGPNAIATIVASRSMSPKKAIAIASSVEFIAPFSAYLIGFNVADTIAGLVNVNLQNENLKIGLLFIAVSVIVAIIWNIMMFKIKMPSSSSHSLIGSIVGAGIVLYGFWEINWSTVLIKVVLVMFLAPVFVFIIGFLVMKIIDLITRNSHIKVNKFFIKSQTFNMIFLSFAHSLNESQRSIGLVMLLSGICYGTRKMVPVWSVALAGLALSLGIMLGGFRIIKTVGNGIYRLRPKHSFASQLSSSIVLMTSSFIGMPISTTQIISSSIIGVGSSQKMKSVRWLVVRNILISWFVTIPATMLLSGGIFYLIKILFL